jgi:hypothetical protein
LAHRRDNCFAEDSNGPKESNVNKWMIGGALIGCVSAFTHLKYTWDAEDIGTFFGSLIGGAFFGGLIARVRNYFVLK